MQGFGPAENTMGICRRRARRLGMVNRNFRFQSIFQYGATVALACMFAGCDPHANEMAALKVENEHLRTEIANLRRKASGAKDEEPVSGKPDLILGINELWTQRFEDNEFRAKQRLAGKTLRVTGVLDGISGDNLSLYGVGKARSARIGVNLEKSYAMKVQGGLAALEKGVTLTVQGKFAYDRMELNDSVVVDKASGAQLTSEQLQTVGLGGVPVLTPLPENK